MSGAGMNSASHPSSVNNPTGAFMKISISYKHVESHKPVEVEVAKHVEKLEKFLQSYSPDLIQLHGVFSENPRKKEHSCALNLSLPTGTLHATASASHPRVGCKKAFSELESQIKKHQSRLRKDYEWKRKRPHPRPTLAPLTGDA
jgi:ribosomal subunit interface protein